MIVTGLAISNKGELCPSPTDLIVSPKQFLNQPIAKKLPSDSSLSAILCRAVAVSAYDFPYKGFDNCFRTGF